MTGCQALHDWYMHTAPSSTFANPSPHQPFPPTHQLMPERNLRGPQTDSSTDQRGETPHLMGPSDGSRLQTQSSSDATLTGAPFYLALDDAAQIRG